MLRRTFLAATALAAANGVSGSLIEFANHKFAFKIRTKGGGIVGNVLIEAHDEDAAKVKLMKRYPGCTVLSVTER
jgi:hypothetical protein